MPRVAQISLLVALAASIPALVWVLVMVMVMVRMRMRVRARLGPALLLALAASLPHSRPSIALYPHPRPHHHPHLLTLTLALTLTCSPSPIPIPSSISSPSPTRLPQHHCQPHRYPHRWAAFVQFLSGIIFLVACVAGLPGLIEGREMEVLFVYIPSVVGSVGFTFASYIYLMEVTHSINPLPPPQNFTVGYLIATLNLGGSLIYTIASCFYFYPEGEEEEGLSASPALLSLLRPTGTSSTIASTIATKVASALNAPSLDASSLDAVSPTIAPYDTAYYVSEWGVRFLYGLGSVCFVISSALSFPELFSK
mmetsp:Transcript_35292/g.70376  ORF Transcript_35292/g.70376 Transcript_35292/m.70376 type:complete len:310 (-) Transcript_35292:64-993(-)